MFKMSSLFTPALLFFVLSTILLIAPTAAQDDMGADQQAMMEAWSRAATPGKAHEGLAKQTGTWSATVKAWMDPSGEPTVSKGTFRREMGLGGRVLQERYEGEVMGMPFEGFGMTGFDNVSGRYWNTWNDNLSTGPMILWGEWSDKEKALVYHGSAPDPASGAMVEMMTIVRHPDKDREVVEMYDLRTGEPVKTMEIVAVRK